MSRRARVPAGGGLAAVLVATALFGGLGCGSSGGAQAWPEDECTYKRHRGLCEAQVTLDPRESESPDEATVLEVRWTWLGQTPTDVPRRTSRWFLTAREAVPLARAIDDVGKSPCVVEEAVAPAECVGRARILSVEAAP